MSHWGHSAIKHPHKGECIIGTQKCKTMAMCCLLFIKLGPNCIIGWHFISWRFKGILTVWQYEAPLCVYTPARAIYLTEQLLLDTCLIQIWHWDYWSSNRFSVDRQTKKSTWLCLLRENSSSWKWKWNRGGVWKTVNLKCMTGLVNQAEWKVTLWHFRWQKHLRDTVIQIMTGMLWFNKGGSIFDGSVQNIKRLEHKSH